jgi:hypothetical protein
MIEIAQRVYRGLPDEPKTERGKRQAALPPDLACDVAAWREISADTARDALMFPSERGTFLSRDNRLRRNGRGVGSVDKMLSSAAGIPAKTRGSSADDR